MFEIHLSFKFATVIAKRGEITHSFPCAFYLHNDEWLFGDRKGRKPLNYTLEFVRKTGGEYLSLLELQSEQDLEVSKVCFANGERLEQVCERSGFRFGREIDMNRDAWRFTPVSEILLEGKDARDPDTAKQLLEMGYLIVHEGKTFHQYTDKWGDPPKIIINLNKCLEKDTLLKASRYYRLQFREITHATNERTVIASIEPVGVINSLTATNEKTPWLRCSYKALYFAGVFNSFIFDWVSRQFVQVHLTLSILNNLRFPPNISKISSLLSHSALRLTCNHSGYELLWREQLGTEWREPNREAFTYPVLETEDQRWQIRAAIDAVVAAAYGLTRAQYAHVLSTFSHKSYLQAPHLCLNYFDELQAIGLETFTRKYDPYWDIPLNENLPQPVIDLPIPITPPQDPELLDTSQFINEVKPKKRKSKK